jgi:NAD-dependent dihydropyrimidine dehydrogenase PreA subunit
MAYYIAGAILGIWFIGGFYRHIQGKHKVVHVVEGKCTGCKRCLTNMMKCKHNVLELADDEKGKHIVVKYPDKCTACGDCVGICKFKALELVNLKTK